MVVKASQTFNYFDNIVTGCWKPLATTNPSILEFLELLGFAQYTSENKSLIWCKSNPISLPLKILATKLPPGESNLIAIFRAASTS